MDTKKITDVADLNCLWQVDNLLLAGQPSAQSLDDLSSYGIKKIFNLRAIEEADQTEIMAKAKELGIEYEHLPIMEGGTLSKVNCEKLSTQINENDTFLIHCASANRVGGWLITYLTKYRGVEFETAIDIASESGLSNPGFIAQAEEVLED